MNEVKLLECLKQINIALNRFQAFDKKLRKRETPLPAKSIYEENIIGFDDPECQELILDAALAITKNARRAKMILRNRNYY